MSVGLINNSSIERRHAKDFDKKNKVLFYLGSHENGNFYSQGSSYSREVREKITSILKNKGLLDEKLIGELSDVCLTKKCSTEEDRERKGDSIVEVAKAISLAQRNKVLNYLEEHKNDNSYPQEVRNEISFILDGEILRLGYVISNKDLLDEELIDELYNACLTKACLNKEDRKRKGEAIVKVAKKMHDEKKETEKNTKLNGVKKSDQTGNSPQWCEKDINSEKVKDSSKLKESYDEVLNTFRGRDLKVSLFEINGKIIGENYEIKAVKSGDIQSKGKNSDKRVTFDDLTGVSMLSLYDMPCDKNSVNSTFAIPKEEALSKKEKIDFTNKNRDKNEKLIEAKMLNLMQKQQEAK